MKYVILPILKFLLAVFCTVICVVAITIMVICHTVWYFKVPPAKFFETYYNPRDPGITCYYKHNPNNFDKATFKTVFHFIWNIN